MAPKPNKIQTDAVDVSLSYQGSPEVLDTYPELAGKPRHCLLSSAFISDE
jgi:hypothetical protein